MWRHGSRRRDPPLLEFTPSITSMTAVSFGKHHSFAIAASAATNVASPRPAPLAKRLLAGASAVGALALGAPAAASPVARHADDLVVVDAGGGSAVGPVLVWQWLCTVIIWLRELD